MEHKEPEIQFDDETIDFESPEMSDTGHKQNLKPRKDKQYKDFMVKLKDFYRSNAIWLTIVFIILSVPVLLWLFLLFTNLWTHHGDTTTVPAIKGMQYEQAINALDEANLMAVISDSIYDSRQRGGTIVEVYPKAGAVVKGGREVYLTIVAFSPRTVIIDFPLTDISLKQAENYLSARGISSVKIEYVPSEYDNIVVSAKVNGKPIGMGSKVQANATVVLEIGQSVKALDAYIDEQVDSIFASDPADVSGITANPDSIN